MRVPGTPFLSQCCNCPACCTGSYRRAGFLGFNGCTMNVFVAVFVCFWPRHLACGILVPQVPGIKPVPLAVEVWSPNNWTTREVLIMNV